MIVNLVVGLFTLEVAYIGEQLEVLVRYSTSGCGTAGVTLHSSSQDKDTHLKNLAEGSPEDTRQPSGNYALVNAPFELSCRQQDAHAAELDLRSFTPHPVN
jgi:hypothetical protein